MMVFLLAHDVVCYVHADDISRLRCWCDALSHPGMEGLLVSQRTHELSKWALAPNLEVSREHMVPERSSLCC